MVMQAHDGELKGGQLHLGASATTLTCMGVMFAYLYILLTCFMEPIWIQVDSWATHMGSSATKCIILF